uniref:Proteasome activator subunit 1 n=1 Tax=Pseudonaja textilis TaxID=8673 RepID=A0A670ZYP8_PSETE
MATLEVSPVCEAQVNGWWGWGKSPRPLPTPRGSGLPCWTSAWRLPGRGFFLPSPRRDPSSVALLGGWGGWVVGGGWEEKAPPCGPVCHNEKITALLNRVKPEIQGAKEKLNVICLWLQLLVPRIEDGNNFGVAVQEKVYELLTAARTKLEGFQTHISKYYSERGDAVSKAAKSPHVGDYRQLVHEIDEAEYAEIRFMINELRNIYAVIYDSVLKNFDKIKKPRDENKGMIY